MSIRLKQLAHRIRTTQSAIDFNEAVTEAVQLIEAASLETIGTEMREPPDSVELATAAKLNNANVLAARVALADATATIQEMQKRIDATVLEANWLQRWVGDLQAKTFVNCVYCGHRYGPSETTPVSMADALKLHIEACPKHPMAAYRRKAEAFDAIASQVDRWENEERCQSHSSMDLIEGLVKEARAPKGEERTQ